MRPNEKKYIHKKKVVFLIAVLITLQSYLLHAGERIPAFPGAEGFGAYSIGGRGGKILFVSNLKDYNPSKEDPIAGSLRAACETKGPRTIIFRVSGTIPLKSALIIKEPYITIAGQSAPGVGICLKNYRLQIAANEVVIRYLRVRPADNMAQEDGFRGDEIDAISVYYARNVIIDHCSASWSVDETLSVTHSDSVTIQWCMITESLNCSAHHKGCHGYGSLVRGEKGAKVTYHHNLYAHHANRNPRPGGHISYKDDPEGWTFDFRNNVIYNWGAETAGYNMDGIGQPDCVTKMNFIGNYYIQGTDSKGSLAFNERSTQAIAYFEDNWMNGVCPKDPWSLVSFGKRRTAEQKKTYKASKPFNTAYVTTDDAYTALQKVNANAGVTLPVRDAVDARVINHVINKLSGSGDFGCIIDDEEDVGGWPELKSIPAPEDKDEDGMSDAWEIKNGFNPNDPSDASWDKDKDGYTNIEEFLNVTNAIAKNTD
jgi:hypothetical protein